MAHLYNTIACVAPLKVLLLLRLISAAIWNVIAFLSLQPVFCPYSTCCQQNHRFIHTKKSSLFKANCQNPAVLGENQVHYIQNTLTLILQEAKFSNFFQSPSTQSSLIWVLRLKEENLDFNTVNNNDNKAMCQCDDENINQNGL